MVYVHQKINAHLILKNAYVYNSMNLYLLFKSLHLIAIVSWMAGLLYLPRIFVYHVENFEKKQAIEIFKVMERKLYFYIMYPAMVLSWIFGLILLSINGDKPRSRLPATLGATVLAIQNGVDIIRVHDIEETFKVKTIIQRINYLKPSNAEVVINNEI